MRNWSCLSAKMPCCLLFRSRIDFARMWWEQLELVPWSASLGGASDFRCQRLGWLQCWQMQRLMVMNLCRSDWSPGNGFLDCSKPLLWLFFYPVALQGVVASSPASSRTNLLPWGQVWTNGWMCFLTPSPTPNIFFYHLTELSFHIKRLFLCVCGFQNFYFPIPLYLASQGGLKSARSW